MVLYDSSISGTKDIGHTGRVTTHHHTQAPSGHVAEYSPVNSTLFWKAVCERMHMRMLRVPTPRSKKEFVIWMGFCVPQSKNYTLFSVMMAFIPFPRQ